MRLVFFTLAVLGCSPGPAPREEPSVVVESGGPPSAAPAQPTGELVSVAAPGLVGQLVLNEALSMTHPAEYCLDDGKRYQGAPARIGALNVFTAASLDDLAGKTVLAQGRREPSLLAALAELGPCPADYGASQPLAQMRSDWVSPEGGFQTSRAKLERLPAFRAERVVPLELAREIERAADSVVVEIDNPFAATLTGVRARAHYEGGPGKPMPLFEPLVLDVAPGASQRFELAHVIEGGPAGARSGEPRGSYRLHSIDLDGRVGEIELDVRMFLGGKSSPRRR